MELARFCGNGIDAEDDRVDRAGDGDVSGRIDVSVEYVSHVFRDVDALDLIHFDPCIEPDVLKPVPVDASSHASCSCRPVADRYVVEEDSVVVEVECSVCEIWDIGVCHLQHGLFKARAFTADGQVVKRSVEDDVT